MSAPAATAVRPSWQDLPDGLRRALSSQLGPITATRTQTGGFTPGLASRLQLASGDRVFVKGITVGHARAGQYHAEAVTCQHLPASAPAPRLRWAGDVGGWTILVFDDIDGRHADLSPGSPDVDGVVATVAGLASVLTPCPAPGVPTAISELGGLVHGWRDLAAGHALDLDPWAAHNLLDLARLETRWLPHAAGNTLLHGDINQANLLIGQAGSVWLVDWAQPVCGAAWIDVADLVPHLVLAGHSPASAERAVAHLPAWQHTPPWVITSYAAAFAGYWTRSSRLPAPPQVPNLRGYQACAARAALAWTTYRLGES